MEELRKIGMFQSLSNVELAKLVPLVERSTLPQGALMAPPTGEQGSVWFILEGNGELTTDHEGQSVPLAMLGPGDAYGQLLPDLPMPAESLRARTALSLVRIRSDSFHALCETTPAVRAGVTRWMSERLTAAHAELMRSKRVLAAYAAELWYTHDQAPGMPDPETQEAAAANALDPEAVYEQPPVTTSPVRARISTRTVLGGTMWAALLGLHIWAYTAPPAKDVMVLALLIWGAVNWLLNIIPDYGVALALVASAAGMALAPLPTILSGFTNTAFFLLMGIYGMGAAIQRTGLLYRFALFMLRKLPPSYGGQSFALALTGLLLTPILPSANGRVTIASPLVQELSEAMRFPVRSSGSGGLLLSALHGFGQMYFLFMSGGTCLVLWGLLPEPYRSQITFIRWLLLSLPLGLVVFFAFLAVVYFIPGARTGASVSRRVLDMQLATLGPMSNQERLTLAITGLVFVLFATQPFHHIDAAWPALIGLVLLLTTGTVDRSAFLQKIDWTYLAFFGAVIGFADLVRYVHLDRELGQVARFVLAPTVHSPALFLGAIVLLTYLIRIAIPWSATVPLMTLAITPVVLAGGYHPFVAGLVILASSNPFMFPNQNLLFLNAQSATSERVISTKMGARYGWIHAAVVLVAVMATAPVWKLFGMAP